MDECSICLESITIDTDNYKLNCNHNFHTKCIMRWLTEQMTCPNCRSKIQADHRYVNDGIINETQRISLEHAQIICTIAAFGTELLFPNGLHNYTSTITNFVNSEDGRNSLEQYLDGNSNIFLFQIVNQFFGTLFSN